ETNLTTHNWIGQVGAWIGFLPNKKKSRKPIQAPTWPIQLWVVRLVSVLLTEMSRGSYESKATSVSTDTAMSAMPMMSPKPRAWTWLDDALRAMGASLRHDISKFNSRFVPDPCSAG